MFLVDANVLVYTLHKGLPQHEASRSWLDQSLAGHPQSVALPWPAVLGFLRIVANKKIFPSAAPMAQAWSQVQQWLDAPAAWTPVPGLRHRRILGELIEACQPNGALLTDLHLAALAMENGLTVVSADAGFGRIPGVRWANPLAGK